MFVDGGVNSAGIFGDAGANPEGLLDGGIEESDVETGYLSHRRRGLGNG